MKSRLGARPNHHRRQQIVACATIDIDGTYIACLAVDVSPEFVQTLVQIEQELVVGLVGGQRFGRTQNVIDVVAGIVQQILGSRADLNVFDV